MSRLEARTRLQTILRENLRRMQDNGELFDDKMKRLTGQIAEQFAKSKESEETIRSNLSGLGYDFEMSFRTE